MAKNVQSSEKNGTVRSNGVENGNGTHSVAGLVVAGLVTIIGSWIGMAAYMDYRLQNMEERLANETRQQVVSVLDNTRTTMNNQMNQLTQGLTTKIDDTAAVLAKGLMDIDQKQESNQNDSLKKIYGFFIEFQQSSQTTLQNQMQSLQDKISQIDTEVEDSVKDMNRSLETLARSSLASNDAVVASVQTLDNHLAEMNAGLLTRMASQTKTLEDLVKQSSENNNLQLADLASLMDSVVEGSKDGSKRLSAELASLAQKVSSIQGDLASSQTTVQELKTSIPEWQNTQRQQIQEQMQTVNDSIQTNQQSMQSQIAELQSTFSKIGQHIDSTSESFLRALYMTTEGMEGTKVELKSQMENSKQETTSEIQNLTQSLNEVVEKIGTLQKSVSDQANPSQSSALPFENLPQLKQLRAEFNAIAQKTSDLHSQIENQVVEIKIRTENWETDNKEADQSEVLRDMLYDYTSLADEVQNHLDTLLDGLGSIDSLLETVQNRDDSPQLDTAMHNSSSLRDENQVKVIGLNPEERITTTP